MRYSSRPASVSTPSSVYTIQVSTFELGRGLGWFGGIMRSFWEKKQKERQSKYTTGLAILLSNKVPWNIEALKTPVCYLSVSIRVWHGVPGSSASGDCPQLQSVCRLVCSHHKCTWRGTLPSALSGRQDSAPRRLFCGGYLTLLIM